MSKGYTISFFMSALQSVNSRKVTEAGPYYTVSPRKGVFSEKSLALDTWLNGQTEQVFQGNGKFAAYGKTPKARLLKALKNRKVNGSI
jgi:hypothetical protein